MSVTEILIKVLGAILAIVGVFCLLSIVGINVFGIDANPIVAAVLGVLFLGLGIWIIRGGTIRA